MWTKPDCFKNDNEKSNTSGWQEVSTTDGRVFYHNSILKKSVWVKPPELMTDSERLQQPSSQGGLDLKISITTAMDEREDEDEESDGGEAAKKKEVSSEEAKRIFLALLKDKNVDPSWKWDHIHEALKHEERYKLIPKVSEKKKLLAGYIGTIKKHERNTARSKLEQARLEYKQMLSEFKNLNSDMKYNQVVQYFYMDPRYKNVDQKDRENLFQDYLDELFEQEKEEDKKNRKALIARMKDHFLDLPIISSNTKWQEACELLKYNAVWQKLHDLDKLEAFSEYILSKDREEEDIRRRKKVRTERKNRENLRSLIREGIEDDRITFKTKWRQVVKRNLDEPRLVNSYRQPGSAPHEIFSDFKKELVEKNKLIKDSFKKILAKDFNEFSVSLDPAKFKKILLKYPDFQHFESQGTNSLDYYSNYLFVKYKKRVEKAKKKLIKLIVKDVPLNNGNVTFAEVMSVVHERDQSAGYFKCLKEADQLEIVSSVIEKAKVTASNQSSERISTVCCPPTKRKRRRNRRAKRKNPLRSRQWPNPKLSFPKRLSYRSPAKSW